MKQLSDLEFDEKQFSKRQLTQIYSGLAEGLTKKRVLLYARPELNWRQTKEVEEQVKLYARPEFTDVQTGQIRSGKVKNETLKRISEERKKILKKAEKKILALKRRKVRL